MFPQASLTFHPRTLPKPLSRFSLPALLLVSFPYQRSICLPLELTGPVSLEQSSQE